MNIRYLLACLLAVSDSNDHMFTLFSFVDGSMCPRQHHLLSSGLLPLHEETTCWSGCAGSQALHSVDAEGVPACRAWTSWSNSKTLAESIAVHTVLGGQPGSRHGRQQRQSSAKPSLQQAPGCEYLGGAAGALSPCSSRPNCVKFPSFCKATGTACLSKISSSTAGA